MSEQRGFWFCHRCRWTGWAQEGDRHVCKPIAKIAVNTAIASTVEPTQVPFQAPSSAVGSSYPTEGGWAERHGLTGPEAALWRCYELTGDDTSDGPFPGWHDAAVHAVAVLREERDRWEP